MRRTITITLFLLTMITYASAQEADSIDVSKMSKEEILNMSYDQLLELPFEDILILADIVGVSLEELYEMLLNKDVVSASKKVESSFEAPLSTSVISYDEIVNSGARNVEEALRLVPGLIIREKTNGNFDVHLRGNNNMPPKHMFIYSENSLTLVMVDGRPVYNYAHGGTFWEMLPVGIDDIDRIEVVRGPSSALYGPNAVSGVVNIITKEPGSKDLKVQGNVQIGSQSTAISSLGIGKKLNDKMGIRATGNFSTYGRNTDKLFVYKANNKEGAFISKEELDTIQSLETGGYFDVFDPADDIDRMYPHPNLSRQRFGGNMYLFYDENEDIQLSLKGGYQNSEVLSSTMGDNPAAQVGRESSTYYADFDSKVHGLWTKVNLMGGIQDIVKQDTGFKVDIYNMNAALEYDFSPLKNFNVRPGAAYQYCMYNDLPYLRYEGQGFLNGVSEISSIAASLRMDYKWKGLRLIAALRGEKYSTHDDPYFSYQLAALYNINDIHLIRGVVSRANRGPFLVDSYANYYWDRDQRPAPSVIEFSGQTNLDLLQMDQIEIGYRIKPAKNIQIDLELFSSKTKNFGALYPDSVHATSPENAFVHMSYQNIDMTSYQYGVTAELSMVLTKDLTFKMFGTYQQTKVEDLTMASQDHAIQFMITGALTDSSSTSSTDQFPTKEDIENYIAVPNFYGGMNCNYSFLKEKANLSLSGYFYTNHEINLKYGLKEYEIIQSKLIINAKISYKIWNENKVFVNARNILGEKQEFSYMDKIGTLVFIGMHLNF